MMARTSASRARLLALGAAWLASAWLRCALADSVSSARAQQLFDEARALMKDGRYEQACPKLAESQALDPAGGTLLNLGICRRKEGRTATAWTILSQALSQARADGRRNRERTAELQLAELRPGLSRLTVNLSPSQNSEAVTVTVDGTSLAAAELGNARPIDPGKHEVMASATGHKPWSETVTVGPIADDQQLTIPVLELAPELAAPPEPPPIPRPTPLPVPRFVPARAKATRAPNSDAPRAVGYAAVATGALALGVGTYFGARSLSLKSSSNRHWDGEHCTDPACVSDWRDARAAALACDVSLGVSLVALGIGSYLLMRSPSHTLVNAQARIQLRASGTSALLSTTTEF
jgi:hypothetical protein